MSPPGPRVRLGLRAAFEASRSATSPRYYFDWERARAAQEKGENPFSPAISLFLGLDVALGMILEEGLEAAFERHVRLGRACRAGVKAMGLELFSPDEDRSAVVTAIRMPEGVDGGSIVLSMRERSGRHDHRRAGRAAREDRPLRAHRLHRRLRRDDGARRARARHGRGRAPTSSAARRDRGARGVRRARDGVKVLVREPIAEAGIDLLRERFDVDVDSDGDLADQIGDYDAIIIRSGTHLDAGLIDRADG